MYQFYSSWNDPISSLGFESCSVYNLFGVLHPWVTYGGLPMVVDLKRKHENNFVWILSQNNKPRSVMMIMMMMILIRSKISNLVLEKEVH